MNKFVMRAAIVLALAQTPAVFAAGPGMERAEREHRAAVAREARDRVVRAERELNAAKEHEREVKQKQEKESPSPQASPSADKK